jgi:hypothetical protein
VQLPLSDLLRQSVYSRLAGYEDVNDAERLSQDPTFRLIGSKKILERGAALTSRLQSFETGVLTQEENLVGLGALNRELVARVEAINSARRIVLDVESTEVAVNGQQEESAYNGHFESTCYHPLLLFNREGDCLAAKLRPGNVQRRRLGRTVAARDRAATGAGQRSDLPRRRRQLYQALEERPFRSGRHSFYLAPVGIFKGREKYIVIMCALDHQWQTLCEVMDQPELVKDVRFTTREERIRNLPALVEVIEGWLRSMPSDEAAMDAMRARRVPMAPVLTVAEAVKHPHLRQRGTIRKVHDRALGDFELPGFALRFSDFPRPLDLEAPFLGEHNEEIFSRYLGYDAGQVKELERYRHTRVRGGYRTWRMPLSEAFWIASSKRWRVSARSKPGLTGLPS